MKQIPYNHSNTVLEKSRVKLMYPPNHRAVHHFLAAQKISPIFSHFFPITHGNQDLGMEKMGLDPPNCCYSLQIIILSSQLINSKMSKIKLVISD